MSLTISQMNYKVDEFIFGFWSRRVTADTSLKLTSSTFGPRNALYRVIRSCLLHHLFQLWGLANGASADTSLSLWGHMPQTHWLSDSVFIDSQGNTL